MPHSWPVAENASGGVPATNLSLAPVIVPLILVGSGFALAVSSLTTVAVNTVPNHLAGMASGSTNMLRDFGFTLGPAIVGAVALSVLPRFPDE